MGSSGRQLAVLRRADAPVADGATSLATARVRHGRALPIVVGAPPNGEGVASELGVDALPDQRFRHLSAADLASRQLEQIWKAVKAHGDRLLVAVPAYMAPTRLGLFLGICKELGIPIAGLVDAAVAATRREYINAIPVHVDVSLHSTLLTRLGQPGRAQVEKSALVESSGLVALHEAWMRSIAESFVRQSRFDPLHTA